MQKASTSTMPQENGKKLHNMHDIISIASYVLQSENVMVTMKLHKICYLIDREYKEQTGEHIIDEQPICGPVGPIYETLYKKTHKSKTSKMLAHKNEFPKPPKLKHIEKRVADTIIEQYKNMTGAELSAMFIASPTLSKTCIPPEDFFIN